MNVSYGSAEGIAGASGIQRNAVSRLLSNRNFYCFVIKCLTIPAVALAVYALFSFDNLGTAKIFNDIVTAFVILSGVALFALNILYYVWMCVLVCIYKPIKSVSDERLLTCSVIVPAYNEGKLIADAIKSLLDADYPAEKLQIIAINDGSKDDTWYWMKKAADESNGRVEAVNMLRNGGKRLALYHGIMKARGEIVVTVDSDSVIMKDAIRNLVTPLALNPKVGGVAGSVRVLNKPDGIIPKMLDVRFMFSFDFIRSAQSVFGSVICTPGALSAYRKDIFLNVMDEWLNRKFLGLTVHAGEDRAITNLVMREGFDVVYQSNSVVYTAVPTDYSGLSKMLVRWARSNVRENLYMGEFAFRKFTPKAVLGNQLNLIMQVLWMITPCFFFPVMIYFAMVEPTVLLPKMLGVIMMWSSISALFYFSKHPSSDALWSYVYGVFHGVTLAWIMPYSFITARNSGWLTRVNATPEITDVSKIETVNS